MKHSHKPKRDSISNMHEYQSVTKKRLALSMVIIGSVMILEIVGSFLSHSLALASEAAHMSTHLFALAVSLVAVAVACKEPCHHRTYGFYRAEVLAALFNGLFLFGVTAYIFFQGIERLLHPQVVNGFEMLIVALFGLVANGLSILILRNNVRSDLNIRSVFIHMFADLGSSVVIIIGAIIVSSTNLYVIDPLLSIGISIVIFVWAWGLLKDSVNILLETAPKGMNVDIISAELQKEIPEITHVTDMHIWEITSGLYSFTAHLQTNVTDSEKLRELLERIDKLLDEKHGIEHSTVQFETTSS
ncbi:MAG TPA: cation diffusion facilitator family transporter [Candidatus Nanoarchaeia archaeon]|nr:cation diffusion facilitator family transporter [Candidatus Nanoarchaeia archaeon]